MLPYRFEFETDEQYEARTGVPADPGSTEDPPSTNAVTEVQPSPNSEGSSSFFVFPWWLVVIVFLLLVIAFYESYRRKLTRAIRQQAAELEKAAAESPPPSKPQPPASSFVPPDEIRPTESPAVDHVAQLPLPPPPLTPVVEGPPEGWTRRDVVPKAAVPEERQARSLPTKKPRRRTATSRPKTRAGAVASDRYTGAKALRSAGSGALKSRATP